MTNPPGSPPSQSGVSRLAWAWAAFAAVLVARLLVLGQFGADLPIGDQWDSEGWSLFRPYEQGELTLAMFFNPHNEHRIALSRLLALAIYLANNHQWDNLVEATVNAFCYSALVALIVVKLRSLLTLRLFLVALPVLLLAACLPFDWENLLIGFQSPFYMQAALTLFAVWTATTSPLSWKNAVLLVGTSALCLFTVASGCFTATAIMVALLIHPGTKPTQPRTLVTLVLLGAVFVMGILITPHVDYHDSLRAEGIGEFLASLGRVLAWPSPFGSWGAAVVVWSPTLLGFLRVAQRRDTSAPFRIALAIALWVGAQAAAIAWSRGHGLDSIAPRYTDTLALGVLANAVLWLLVCERWSQTSKRRWLPLTLGPVAMLGLSIGLIGQTILNIPSLQFLALARPQQSEVVRQYLESGDQAAFRSQPPVLIPYPDPTRLLMMLDDAHIKAALPISARLALPLGDGGSDFVPNSLPSLASKDAPTPNLSTFGTSRPALRYQSAPLQTALPVIAISVCGNLNADHIGLWLDGPQGRRQLLPSGRTECWKTLFASAPGTPVKIIAEDNDVEAWFALARPVEAGRLTYLVHIVLDRSLEIGAALILLCLISGLVGLRRHQLNSLVAQADSA